ncbi:hypothetical protein NIA71_08140 [Ihubacter massiliensis]|uniref:Uncharacterized protein n=1 Tax=Hominibacterium faecale TaxID=2839743 RepID=A0A9J6QZQ5_9FIRM|nr:MULTISPECIES: hypothetical protein [Eubacteriales Family XIII. Incertae Sedis]MCO7121919.1 hypothetical protein [Ihubacter massiliensis]MCU7380943.1 hypothetical protein [Hominibacterium faecale]
MLAGYTDYGFYKDRYLGQIITEPAFSALSLKASYFIDMVTFHRIDHESVTDDVKMAVCAAAEVILKHEESSGKSSESVGKLSITYDTRKTEEKKMYAAIQPYLAHTGLLYRGVGK